MKRLKDFWKWLARSDEFGWKRPDGHEDLRLRVARLPDDSRKLLASQVETFTVDELAVLYKNATPLVRSFLLLGLNCGFSIAEIASLTQDEVKDGWIKRIRVKSGVLGQFKLWPESVAALEWAKERSRKLGEKKLMFCTASGKAYNQLTATGNKSSKIPSLWNHLYKTVGIRKLPFKMIRKTAGNLVREIANGEIAGVFLCHGTPVKADTLLDKYTNRPFEKVAEATDKLRKILAPMFKGV